MKPIRPHFFWRWYWPDGSYSLAWRFTSRKACEWHGRGFKGKAVRVMETWK